MMTRLLTLATIVLLPQLAGAQSPARYMSAGLEYGAFNYRWARDDDQFSPVVSGFIEQELSRTVFVRGSLSHTWSRAGVVCPADSPCPRDAPNPLTLARIVFGAGIPIGHARVHGSAGPEYLLRDRIDGSKFILVWGVGMDVAVTRRIGVTFEHVRHRDNENHEYTGDSWELSGGLRWMLH